MIYKLFYGIGFLIVTVISLVHSGDFIQGFFTGIAAMISLFYFFWLIIDMKDLEEE